MSITCPACNKAGQTTDTCARCGCDLAILHRIKEAAWRRLAEARQALAAGDYRQSLLWAEHAWRLDRTRESAGLAFLAAAALHETEPALRWRERAATGDP